eukprot:1194832-Prorocentrum_minimum.AAC.3
MFGAERAAFTKEVCSAYRENNPVPTLTNFRKAHPGLKGTSSFRSPFSTSQSYLTSQRRGGHRRLHRTSANRRPPLTG